MGHLVQLSQADAYDEKYKKWALEHLPIAPKDWKLNIIEGKEKQFNLLKKLMNDKRIESLICATDAGREGELIFRFVYEHAQCQKPFERLWTSSLEDQAIKDGFANLKDGKEYDNLYDSAISRAKADWLIGINETRLFSCLYKHPLHVGRVQSPTLAMIVEQDQKIIQFVKEKSYKVNLKFDNFEAQSASYQSLQEAQELQRACEKSQAQVISIEEKESRLSSPPLFDLTTLQRTANRLYGYSAKDTLNAAQSLYEKKLISYPRTDSKYITNDMLSNVEELVKIAFDYKNIQHKKPNIDKLIDNKKVNDHHALLPTTNISKIDINLLSNIEKDILNLIISQLIIATADEHIFTTQTANIICADTAFTAKSKTILQNGWKEIEAQLLSKKENVEKTLPILVQMQELDTKSIGITEHESQPPKTYTEDTLLSAMENAGKTELDKSLDKGSRTSKQSGLCGKEERQRKEADARRNASEANCSLSRRGLGTPATRASVIEKLISTGSIERNNKQLISTLKGRLLCEVLPTKLKSANLTASWENQLSQIASGEMPYDIFMNGIYALSNELMDYKNSEINENLFQVDKETVGACPRCQNSVFESAKNFYCADKECKFVMWKEDKFFTLKKTKLSKKNAQELLRDGRTPMKNLFSLKTGKTYDATVILDDTGDKYVNYVLEFTKD